MKTKTQEHNNAPGIHEALPRRAFMKYAGLSVASAGLILAGCKKKDSDSPAPVISTTAVNLGSGDPGILNYAYALEQLEAAFYTSVVAATSFATIFSASEQKLLTDIKAHEITHREFLKTALGTNAIPALEVNFSAINFNDRTSVLNTAKAFEDLGVAAYNGAGQLISSTAYLLLAGKIVSVEARHAAAIRDLISPKTASFAGDDVVTADQGLDGAKPPSAVLAIAGAYLTTQLNYSNLPTA
jgi:hypothetical protein